MPKQYVKTGTSLVPVSEDKIRNYESLECVRAAIQRGELTENDLFTTVCNVQAICDDLAHELYRVISYIPATTNSTDNKLLNHCDIAGIGGNTDVQVGSCVNHASDGLVDITTSVQSLITTETTNKVSCSDYQAFTTGISRCPGLDCEGDVTKTEVNAMFVLSGNNLTIHHIL